MEKTEQERYDILRNGVTELFNHFIKGFDVLKKIHWTDYNTLEKHCDLFNPSKEMKLEAMERAKDVLTAEIKANIFKQRNKVAMMMTGTQEQKDAKRMKKVLIDQMATEPTKDEIINKAKCILVYDFFKNLKEMDMKLELPEKIES